MIKNKRGFTLVELIAVMALIGVIGVAVAGMLVPASNAYIDVDRNVQAKMKADQVIDTVRNQVRYGKSLQILADPGSVGGMANMRYLYSQNGKVFLYKDGGTKDLFGDKFYAGYRVDISARKVENSLLSISCRVTLPGFPEVSCTLETSVNVLNTEDITGSEGSILAYGWENP